MVDEKQKKIARHYAKRIIDECQSGDEEADHVERDKLLEQCLIALGATEVAEASRKVEGSGFWYA